MQKEDLIIEMLKNISDQQKRDREENNRRFEKIDSKFEKIDSKFEKVDFRFEKMEEQRKEDKKELITLISDNKKEVLDRISASEANANVHFTNISNTLAHERLRLDAVYETREEVKVNWSNKLMAMNSAFAGIVAFVVSSFK